MWIRSIPVAQLCAAHYPLGVREAVAPEPTLSLSALNHTVLLLLSVTLSMFLKAVPD